MFGLTASIVLKNLTLSDVQKIVEALNTAVAQTVPAASLMSSTVAVTQEPANAA